MDLLHGFLFFSLMLLLSAVPGTSTALVVARSAMRGLGNGAAVTAGIVLGDIIFILLALLGLNALDETTGVYFAFFKYTAGGWLIWQGIVLLQRRPPIANEAMEPSRATLWSSFGAGLLVTLGDIKALFLYTSLLPAFVATDRPDPRVIFFLILTIILTVGGTKMTYAFAARRLMKRFRKREEGWPVIRRVAGAALIGAAVYLIASS